MSSPSPLTLYRGPAGDHNDRLADALGGRPAYVHLDCDVLEPGLLRTDYAVPGGLTLEDLSECAETAAAHEVIGLEVGELEGEPEAGLGDLVEALEPVLRVVGDQEAQR